MWDELKEKNRPLVLYGTGDAAEKILKQLDIRGIRVSGIFASDGFVRDRSFAGFKVLSYAEAKEKFGPMTVLLCFGSHRPDVIETIKRVAAEQDFYAPDLPVAGDGLFDRAFYEAHREDLAWVRERLADEQSRLVLDKVIEYKLTGRIDPLLECETPEEDNWKLLKTSFESRSSMEKAASFLDLGAYTGDTVELFLKVFDGRYSDIIAVEPESRNFRKLSENTAGLEKVRLVNAAAGDRCGEIPFTHGAGRGGAAGKGKVRPVSLETVDNLLSGRSIDIIKMDLEGAEGQAILGAEETIKRFKPAMLISAYHRTEDLFALPGQVLGMAPDYRIYLRKDPCLPAWGISYFFIV